MGKFVRYGVSSAEEQGFLRAGGRRSLPDGELYVPRDGLEARQVEARRILNARPKGTFGVGRTDAEWARSNAMADAAMAILPDIGGFLDEESLARAGAELDDATARAREKFKKKAAPRKPPDSAVFKPVFTAAKPSPAVKRTVGPTTRDLLDRAAEKLRPNTPFFGDMEVKGSRGNVSPRVIVDFIVGPDAVARSATPGKQDPKSGASTYASTKVAAPSKGHTPGVEDCVERPTGDPHGPGRWRGKWFNWCRE